MKVGDGVKNWLNLPWFPPQATQILLGLVKSSALRLFARVNTDGTVTINGLETELTAINDKNTEQDTEITAIKQQLAGMSGTIIYIGTIGYYTEQLKDMPEAERYAALAERAMEIRGQLMDGYTLEDLGMEDEPNRFNYWQYQPDGTWFDLGERGDVSQATDDSLGVVMGSSAQYRIHINADGTMSVNGLQEKFDAVDDDLAENKAASEETARELDDFKQEQEKENEHLVRKEIFNDTNGALVADISLGVTEVEEGEPPDISVEVGGAPDIFIEKTLKNVDNGENCKIKAHITSNDDTILMQLSKLDDENYGLDLSAAPEMEAANEAKQAADAAGSAANAAQQAAAAAQQTANAAAAAVVGETSRAQGVEGTLAAAVADCISSVGMTWV
jgi:hypothetical protein